MPPPPSVLSQALMSLDWPPVKELKFQPRSFKASLTKRRILTTLGELHQWPCRQQARATGVRGVLPVECTYAHLLWALICPCARWISEASEAPEESDDESCESDVSCELDYLVKLLAPDFSCEVEEEVEPDLAELCAIQISAHLLVDFPADAMKPVLERLLCAGLPKHNMSAYLVLMSGVTQTLIGKALHETLMVRLLAVAANIPEPDHAEPHGGQVEARDPCVAPGKATDTWDKRVAELAPGGATD